MTQVSSGKQIEAHEKNLNQVLGDDYEFNIPEYQRPYSWGHEQTAEMFDDLTSMLDAGASDPYFLGSVVLVKQPNKPSSDVIDGQQRLTTLTILLAVMRDLLPDGADKNSIEHYLVNQGNTIGGQAARPRLYLRSKDNDFFGKYVQTRGNTGDLISGTANPGNDAQTAIADNAALLHSSMEGWDQQRLVAFAQFLMQNTYLVVVSTADLDAAHRIFAVMNSRGLDLSPADIFKAKVIGAIPDAERADYAQRWENAEEMIGRSDFADLFAHIRMMHAKTRAKKDLLREFTEQVLNNYLPEDATGFVDDLVVPSTEAYAVITSEGYTSAQGAEKVNAWLGRLNRLDNNDWKPVALWALTNHRHEPDQLAGILQRLERLAASMLIRRVYTTPRAQRYGELLTELDEGLGVQSPSFALDAKERRDTLDALNADIYPTPPVRRHVLLRLDEELSNSPGVSYDHSIITVEHVLPQNPKDGSEWSANFTTEQQELWVHRLANLLLLSRKKNSEANRDEFANKKATYFTSASGTSTFALTSQVLAEPAWTPSVLEARQEALLGKLAEVWELHDEHPDDALALKKAKPKTGGAKKSYYGELANLFAAKELLPGTPLRGEYKSEKYHAVITDDGQIEYDGKKYSSPTRAQKAVGTNSDPWTFWMVERDGEWISLAELVDLLRQGR